MLRFMFALVMSVLIVPYGFANKDNTGLTVFPENVKMHDGRVFMAQKGIFKVPENRSKANNKSLTIGFLRFKTTAKKPARPMFLLAGGPGASWTGSLSKKGGYDYKEVAFYQEFADVIIIDQRGSRDAFPAPICYGNMNLPADKPLSMNALFTQERKNVVACKQTWQQQGLDITGFNTIENADDINDLRKALGYKKINLVGGSYGSHLALTLMRRYPQTIGRAMLRGLEGPDQSYGIPTQVLNSVKRFEQALASTSAWKDHVPHGGFIAALKRIQQKLAIEPKTVNIVKDDKKVAVTIGQYDIQNIALSGANSRSNPDAWATMILKMLEGDFTEVATDVHWMRNWQYNIRPMTNMMDCASGASEERLKTIASDPAQDLLGLNYYFNFCDSWAAPDLGADFRKSVISDIPVLFFHGLWDRSTPVENARETIKGFKNGQLAEVENGTHSVTRQLYELWQPMRKTVRDFMYDRDVIIPSKITLPLPVFKGPQIK